MKIINLIMIIIMLITYGLVSYQLYNSNHEKQLELYGYFITIDVTILGFLMTLISIIAAIRSNKIVNDYLNTHGDMFKSIFALTFIAGSVSIFICLFLITLSTGMVNNIFLIIFIAFQLIFITSCVLNTYNMFEMIFKKNFKVNKNENIYK